MGRLFKLRWPLFARLEAIILFVASLVACHRLAALYPALDDLATVEATGWGIPKPLLTCGVLAFITAGPYLGTMLLADRLMAARNGLAWLSVLAVAAWSGVALVLSTDLCEAGWNVDASPLPIPVIAAISAASAALLAHARPLWIGLNDRGDVAYTLLPDAQHEPVSRSGVTIFATVTVVVVSLVTARARLAPPPPQPPLPAIQTPREGVVPVPPPYPPPQTDAMVEAPPPLPRTITPDRDAVATRQPNRSYRFQVDIKGILVPMIFDTGASVVSLSAEDATRIGIPIESLNYSIRLNTANGVALAAPVMISQMTIGPIKVANIPALVAKKGAMPESLLGQTFLEKLKSYDVESNRVTLHGW